MKYVDALLNKITMYRLVVYGLGVLGALGFVLAASGRLAFNPAHMAESLAVLLVAGYVTNKIFARIWQVPTNSESWLITALILFLILPPPSRTGNLLALAAAGALSSASKFVLAIRGKHIFNPAALAAGFLSLSAWYPASWWVGTSALWPYSLVIGLLVVRKIRRFTMVITFAVVAIALQAAVLVNHHLLSSVSMNHALVASPLIFLATIMLTEPATIPPRRGEQATFAGIAAVLYVMSWKIGPLVIYPEVALLIANVYAYLVSPKFRLRLQLKEVQKISDRVYSYVFLPDRKFSFLPGQYMEWTLAGVPYDNRGNRRTFTVASSPTENEVYVGLKYYEPTSMYKYEFSRMKPGDVLYASQLAGNFTLNGNENRKLAFIAGGIGITPFRSMIKYLTDTDTKCDIVLLYSVSDPSELAYKKELQEAAVVGVKTIAISSSPSPEYPDVIPRRLSSELIEKAVPDYGERLFYVSGPETMVHAARSYLRDLHVSNLNIRTDHFTGY